MQEASVSETAPDAGKPDEPASSRKFEPKDVPAPPPAATVPSQAPPSSGGGRNAEKGHVLPRTVASTGERAAANGKKTPVPAPGRTDEPAWARGNEELVYRVEFLGVTMGYARFLFKGKVTYEGREVYHLSVRAWTSDILSVLYPINDTIEYYLDVKTLAPLRQEFTRAGKKKDDIAFYDQEKGKIVYRYKHNGEIRKQVDVIPDVYDPVTAAYYFRTWDLGVEERPRNVYTGRKLWQISLKRLGMENIDTPRGRFEAVVTQPIIRRDGQLENKGDMKMWMTNDSRHVPVKIYAKFKKIRIWTLIAELMPAQEGG